MGRVPQFPSAPLTNSYEPFPIFFERFPIFLYPKANDAMEWARSIEVFLIVSQECSCAIPSNGRPPRPPPGQYHPRSPNHRALPRCFPSEQPTIPIPPGPLPLPLLLCFPRLKYYQILSVCGDNHRPNLNTRGSRWVIPARGLLTDCLTPSVVVAAMSCFQEFRSRVLGILNFYFRFRREFFLLKPA